ncbi:hypothetical protein N0V87_005476 [Didymella glomerata]|uniref:PEBP-like protein n=1 Tax=Didymella glomerata TaxID=749621 RepID=A0A9W8WYU4_9PLEO|nr:hypothetical protein N0V87_005476 [Didymella glomerata]
MATTALLDSLKSASLLPSPIIPSTFTPTYTLNIAFPSKPPSNGSLVRVSDVATQPSITFSPTDSTSGPSSTFTLLLIDPDAPTPDDPKFAYWRHWVVTSIPTSSSSGSNSSAVQGDVKDGKTVTPYLAPGPKDESGPHRYLFLLFKEPAGFVVKKEDVGGDEFVERRSFGAGKFVEKFGLELVGVQWMRGVGDGWNGGKDEL